MVILRNHRHLHEVSWLGAIFLTENDHVSKAGNRVVGSCASQPGFTDNGAGARRRRWRRSWRRLWWWWRWWLPWWRHGWRRLPWRRLWRWRLPRRRFRRWIPQWRLRSRIPWRSWAPLRVRLGARLRLLPVWLLQ